MSIGHLSPKRIAALNAKVSRIARNIISSTVRSSCMKRFQKIANLRVKSEKRTWRGLNSSLRTKKKNLPLWFYIDSTSYDSKTNITRTLQPRSLPLSRQNSLLTRTERLWLSVFAKKSFPICCLHAGKLRKKVYRSLRSMMIFCFIVLES